MEVESVRIKDDRILVMLAGKEITLPDGTYTGAPGVSVTVVDGEITDVITRLDVESATPEQIKTHLADLDGRLSEMHADLQLANLDLQNALQKQQKQFQAISTLSKMMHDTAKSIVNNMR